MRLILLNFASNRQGLHRSCWPEPNFTQYRRSERRLLRTDAGIVRGSRGGSIHDTAKPITRA